MTLKHLRIFMEVCKQESITRASDSLNMSQPAVSSIIRELESFYNVKLFERMNRRIYITDAGQKLLNYADSIISQFDEAKDVLGDISTAAPIRIGSNVSFGSCYLPALISDFKKIYPLIPVSSLIQNSKQIETKIFNNLLDFAVVDAPLTSQTFDCTFIKEEAMIPLCSASFQQQTLAADNKANLSIADFSWLPLLVREAGSGCRDILDRQFTTSNVSPNIFVESISTQALIAFCLKGQGILFLPESQANIYLDSNKLMQLHISDADFKRKYYLINHRNKYITKSMTCFYEFAKRYF